MLPTAETEELQYEMFQHSRARLCRSHLEQLQVDYFSISLPIEMVNA